LEASSGAWLGTCSGSEEPEPRRPEVAEPPLPGEEEEREEP